MFSHFESSELMKKKQINNLFFKHTILPGTENLEDDQIKFWGFQEKEK